jgi:hypothetical protein
MSNGRQGVKNFNYAELIEQHDTIVADFKKRNLIPSKIDLARKMAVSTNTISKLRRHIHNNSINDAEFKRKYVANLQVTKREKQLKAMESELKQGDEQCSICLDLFIDTPSKRVYITSCNHFFHTECIDKVKEIESTKGALNHQCPLCRNPYQARIREPQPNTYIEARYEPEYTVRRVIGKRIVDNRLEFLIEWEGYGSRDNTWEPFKNLRNCYEKIEEYEEECIELVVL